MNLFLCYMLWQMDSILGFVFFVLTVSIISAIGCFAYYCHNDDIYEENRNEKYNEIAKRYIGYCKKFVMLSIAAVIIFTIIPGTATMMKIIATKQVVDVVQTEKFDDTIDKMGSIVDKSLELLDKKVDKKLSENK